MHSYQLFHQNQQHERQAETRLLLKNFHLLCEQWELSKAESYRLLNLNSLHQMAHWQQSIDNFVLTHVQIERLSFLLSIHKTLEKAIPNKKVAAQWIHQPQKEIEPFNESSPLEVLTKADKHVLGQLVITLAQYFADRPDA